MESGGVLLAAVQAFQRGDAQAAAACMHPAIVWHSPGRRQPAAGTHRGLENVLGAFGTIATAPGSLTLEITAGLSGEDGRQTVLYRHCRDRDGEMLNADIALVARTAEGQLIEVWEYIYDLFAFDEFYGAAA